MIAFLGGDEVTESLTHVSGSGFLPSTYALAATLHPAHSAGSRKESVSISWFSPRLESQRLGDAAGIWVGEQVWESSPEAQAELVGRGH